MDKGGKTIGIGEKDLGIGGKTVMTGGKTVGKCWKNMSMCGNTVGIGGKNMSMCGNTVGIGGKTWVTQEGTSRGAAGPEGASIQPGTKILEKDHGRVS